MTHVLTSPSSDAAYWAWVRAEAAAIDSDGCTGVADWNLDCCLEHDIACERLKDPRLAYVIARLHPDWPRETVWLHTPVLRDGERDARFRDCNRARAGKLGVIGKARAWVRWLGVRLGAAVSGRY